MFPPKAALCYWAVSPELQIILIVSLSLISMSLYSLTYISINIFKFNSFLFTNSGTMWFLLNSQQPGQWLSAQWISNTKKGEVKERELYFIFGSSFCDRMCRSNVMGMLYKCCKCIKAFPIFSFALMYVREYFSYIAIYIIVILCLKSWKNLNEASHVVP